MIIIFAHNLVVINRRDRVGVSQEDQDSLEEIRTKKSIGTKEDSSPHVCVKFDLDEEVNLILTK